MNYYDFDLLERQSRPEHSKEDTQIMQDFCNALTQEMLENLQHNPLMHICIQGERFDFSRMLDGDCKIRCKERDCDGHVIGFRSMTIPRNCARTPADIYKFYISNTWQYDLKKLKV